jgi:hypothetical protein
MVAEPQQAAVLDNAALLCAMREEEKAKQNHTKKELL